MDLDEADVHMDCRPFLRRAVKYEYGNEPVHAVKLSSESR
jgi:hypothetical protein